MVKRTLYFGNPAYLNLQNGQMVFRLLETHDFKIVPEKSGDCNPRTFPIEDIGFVVLDHQQVTITKGLLNALLEAGCCVITCGTNHMPTGMLLPLDGNTLQSERFRLQISCSAPLRKQLWQQTVKAKIINQAAVLTLYTGFEANNMRRWANDVLTDDHTNLEGRAAAFYWRNIFQDYQDFNRDPDGNFPNQLLNYGYAILRAVIARALVCKGLLPTFGIHHHNRYNSYCLADDIMEPYRPYVDIKVIEIISEFGYCELTKEIKRRLLSIPVIEVNIDGHRSPLMVGAEITANSLYKCFAGETKKIIYPEL